MTYSDDKAQRLANMLELQTTRVEYTGRNLLARNARRIRIHNDTFKSSLKTPLIDPIGIWLNNRTLEDSYYMMNSIGHQLKIRKQWTAELIADIESITLGCNQSIDWFLEALGQWLTDHMLGYYVIVQHKVEMIGGRVTEQSLVFLVTRIG
jgi:hypothetical protein